MSNSWHKRHCQHYMASKLLILTSGCMHRIFATTTTTCLLQTNTEICMHTICTTIYPMPWVFYYTPMHRTPTTSSHSIFEYCKKLCLKCLYVCVCARVCVLCVCLRAFMCALVFVVVLVPCVSVHCTNSLSKCST